jgi:hypothetical protein
MRRFILAASTLGMVVGCNEPSGSSVGKPNALNDDIPLRFVMVNKEQRDLIGDQRETTLEDITGVWTDSLLWMNRPPDTCWYGAKCLDRHIRFELKSSKIFIWEETYSDPVHDRTDKGEFFLNNDSSNTTLMIARNRSRDTLFAQGEAMKCRNFRLYWIGKDRILLLPPKSEASGDDYEAFDMVRRKPG